MAMTIPTKTEVVPDWEAVLDTLSADQRVTYYMDEKQVAALRAYANKHHNLSVRLRTVEDCVYELWLGGAPKRRPTK